MKHKVREFNQEVNALMNECIKKMVDTDVLTSMSTEEFDLFTRMFKMMQTSCDLLAEQAEWCDRVEHKIDKLLASAK